MTNETVATWRIGFCADCKWEHVADTNNPAGYRMGVRLCPLHAAAPSLATALQALAYQAGDVADFYQESDAMESLHAALSAAVDALRDAGLDAPEVSTYLAQRSALADIEGGKE